MVKIVECLISPDIYGIRCVDHTTNKVTIYKDKISNICGFRRYIPFHYDGPTHQFIEVNHFLNMLFEGSRLGMEILMCPEEYIIEDSSEYQLIKDIASQFVTKKLIKALVEESEKLEAQLTTSYSIATITTTDVRVIEYDKYAAYQSILNLSLVKDIIKSGTYNCTREDFLTLESIREGRFKYSTIEKQLRSLITEVKESIKVSKLKEEPNKVLINSVVLKIRNIKDGTR